MRWFSKIAQALSFGPVGEASQAEAFKRMAWPGSKPPAIGAYDGDKLVGVLFAGSSGEYVSLDIAVLPEYRRRGIARELTSRFVQRFESQGPEGEYLRVVVANEVLIPMLEDMGFDTVDEMGGDVVMVYDPHGAADDYQGLYN